MAAVWGEQVPDELIVWEMAEAFGWPIEYILNLPEARWREWFAVKAGRNMARNSIIGKGRTDGKR